MYEIAVLNQYFSESQRNNSVMKLSFFIVLFTILIGIWVPLPKMGNFYPPPKPPEPKRPISSIKLPERKTEKPETVELKPLIRKRPVPAEALEPSLEVLVDHADMKVEEPRLALGAWESNFSIPTPASEVLTPNTPGLEMPVFIKKTAPNYPRQALRAGLQGYVILHATLTRQGTVEDIEILRELAKNKFGFEEAAIEALKNWTFIPGHLNNQDVNVRLVLRIDFRLN